MSMADTFAILIRVIQAICLVIKLLYYPIILLDNNTSDTPNRISQSATIFALLSQLVFVFFTTTAGIVSSITWGAFETRIYAASSSVLFVLNLIKYGVRSDTIIFPLDCVLLVLAFLSLRIVVRNERLIACGNEKPLPVLK